MGFGRGQVSSLCFWAKAQLTNIPVTPELRRVEVETEHREVVVWSSTLMLRVQADLDRTYMDGGATAGGSGDTDSCFSLGASLLSGVPHLGCGLVGYCHDPQHSGACRTYFPRPRTRRIDPRSILAEQRTMLDEATKVGMRNTDAHICAPSLFSSQHVYIYPTSTGNFPSLEIN